MGKGKKRRVALLAVILMLLSTNCDSVFAPDEGKLRGTVVSDVGQPVAGAQVVTDPQAKAVTSGAGGGFEFSGLPAGDYTLTASKQAYESSSVRASLEKTGGLSCAEPESSAPTIVLTLAGWTHYSDGQFTQALSDFQDALAENPDCFDAHTGLGWSYAKLDSLEDAVSSFEAALAIRNAFLDALAGLAMVSSALNDHQEVIDSASAVLDRVGNGYVFRRDPNVTSIDLRLVLANSYVETEEFGLAQEQVDILNPDNGLDPDDPDSWWVDGTQYLTYEEALLVELQRLGL
jgi:tetratricopeptide (TPR) repeat protein